MRLPPLPKWNKATDDLDSADFLRRAQDCERSLLPRDMTFPRTGQVWEALRDCKVHVRKWMIGPKGPVRWLDAHLRQRERVLILTLNDPKPLEVTFVPVRYEELHQSIAPQSLGYELWLTTARILRGVGYETGYFSELFHLVENAV